MTICKETWKTVRKPKLMSITFRVTVVSQCQSHAIIDDRPGISSWRGQSHFLFLQKALPLENLKVYWTLLQDQQGQNQGNRGPGLLVNPGL